MNKSVQVERLWDAVVSLEGNPAPEVTLKGPGALDKGKTTWFDSTFVPSHDFEASDAASPPPSDTPGIRTSRVAMQDAPPLPDGRRPQAPDEDYLILEKLGSGGMGVVYAARQGSLGREVAVKMVAPAIVELSGARRKIISEAVIIGELDHPNIIPIYDLAKTERNELFYTMKVVKGTPWSECIASNSLKDNLGILRHVADAVAFSHDKGIIHRDLKPGNVMLGDYGEVLLMDWGLAVSLDPASKAEQLTHVSALAGTPAYMAPEMALGETEKIGKATDIYLLGAVLFEIVSGRRPHRGEDARTCLKQAAANIIAPSPVHDDLLAVVYKAMAVEPADRYRSVKEFQHAIEEVETHRESRTLAARAHKYLARAERNKRYSDFARAIFSYGEAVQLWPGNETARKGEWAARKRFAAIAFGKTDYDLALDSLEGLGDDEARSLASRVANAREEERERKKRIRRLSFMAVCLFVAVVAILAVAIMVVTEQMRREVQVREEVRSALAETSAARERERTTATEREEALQREKAALVREGDAVQARLTALEYAEAERRRKEEAMLARAKLADQMSRKGMLEEASWWAFGPAEAAARRAEAAGKWFLPESLTLSLNGVAADFVLVPPGEFVMGSIPRSPWHVPDEYLHQVVISRPFMLGRTEVTRGLWRAIVGIEDASQLMPPRDPVPAGESDEGFQRFQSEVWGWRTRPLNPDEDALPATGVSAREIDELFLPRAQERIPSGWRAVLPSEAQWEYAARCGSPGRYFGDDPAQRAEPQPPGWTRENSGLRLHAAGRLEANAWGLVDMHGNAGEIVRDVYSIDYYLTSPKQDPQNAQLRPFRVYRGGNVLHTAATSLAASRHYVHIDNRYAQVGFRLALVRDPGATEEAGKE